MAATSTLAIESPSSSPEAERPSCVELAIVSRIRKTGCRDNDIAAETPGQSPGTGQFRLTDTHGVIASRVYSS